MGEVLRKNYLAVTSSSGGAVNSEAVRVGGNLYDVQLKAPDSLVTIQGSSDKQDWFTATEIGGTLLSGLGGSYSASIREGFEWTRLQVALDAGGPQVFAGLVGVHKQASS